MISLIILSVLAGAALAQRFKVRILLPATALIVLGSVCSGLFQSETVGWTMLMGLAGAASIQAGYMFGLGHRYMMEARSIASGPPLRASPSTTHSV